MADIRRSPRLTSDEVARVLHRAATIDAEGHSRNPDGLIDPSAVEEAASEVGLSPTAVRQAMAELRVGALPVASDRAARRAASRFVTEQRIVDGPDATVLDRIDRFMRTQMLEVRRRGDDRAVYRPRADLVASLRRGLDVAGTIRLEGIRTLSVLVTPADTRVLVRIEAELASGRANVIGGAAAAGTGVGMATGLAGMLLGEPVIVIAALPAGAAVGAGGLRLAGERWQRHRDEVAEVLAHLLDGL